MSLMYEGRRITACFSELSKNLEMLVVTLFVQEPMGLQASRFLSSLTRKYIRLVLCISGG